MAQWRIGMRMKNTDSRGATATFTVWVAGGGPYNSKEEAESALVAFVLRGELDVSSFHAIELDENDAKDFEAQDEQSIQVKVMIQDEKG